jgi:hypothetical protein
MESDGGVGLPRNGGSAEASSTVGERAVDMQVGCHDVKGQALGVSYRVCSKFSNVTSVSYDLCALASSRGPHASGHYEAATVLPTPSLDLSHRIL